MGLTNLKRKNRGDYNEVTSPEQKEKNLNCYLNRVADQKNFHGWIKTLPISISGLELNIGLGAYCDQYGNPMCYLTKPVDNISEFVKNNIFCEEDY